ncbi:hypothetical protein [Pseudogemmobacter bohemicus]|uniref:hypothetical protein n=1 Tax=Pseudogemmobacter bohemicus TaxID=2250708 RepID=UPI000DD31CB8|nr:hypothetical protein [Pseudogemmobacter bohemicus]
MSRFISAAVAFLLSTTAIAAAECDTKFEAELRTAVDGMKSLEQARRRLQSRLDGQDFRIGKLAPEADKASLAPAPVLPELALPAAGNGEGCTVTPTRQTEAVTRAGEALDIAKGEVEARDAQLAELEKGAKSAPAEAAPLPESPPVSAGALPAEPEPAAAEAAVPAEATDDVAAPEAAEAGSGSASGAQRPDSAAPDAAATESASEDGTPAGSAPEAAGEAKPAEVATDQPDAPEAGAGDSAAADPATDDIPAVTEGGDAEEPVTADGPMPLTDPENPEAFIRVIAQPGMVSHAEPGATDAGSEVPVFSILYVFERQEVGGEAWMRIGRTVRGGPEGWVRADKGVDWTNMLVMQFAPRGKRQQVLFFDDESALNSLVSSPFYEREALKLYDSIADQRGAPDPDWDSRLVAIEPQSAVTYDSRPYLLPILDWRSEMFDGTTDTTLVRVAALPAAPSSTIGARDEGSFNNSGREAAANSGEFRVGVVFVIDTTISMRPFIDRTRQAVEYFYDAFSKYESSGYVSFGLVGFRDNIDANPNGLEYVTRVFQPLDPEVPASTVLSNLDQISEAKASTKGFSEDSIAGISDAIDENDWSPYDARLIILVTDASARTGEGTADPDMTLTRLREKARQNGIVIVPMHLLTPANAKGDADIARGQYAELAATGDIGSDKYIGIDATSDEKFARTVSRLATEVASATMTVNAGELLRDEDDEPIPEDIADPEEKIAAVVTNEIFRAQLESLGKIDEGAAPAFLSGWASDRDLTSPETETLEVSAFLTRNQLSTLDKRLAAIIEAFRSGGDNPQTFFANLQKLAAETATDPDNIRSGDSSTIEAILPSFLKNLPYRSQVLRLDQGYWTSMSVAQQQEFIENLEAKRKIYEDIFNQTKNWADFGAGDPGLEATPVRLTHLP